MAAEEGAAGWQSPPCLTVEEHPGSLVSNEHLTLLDFAHRLGSTITNNESGIADESNVRQDANLLMSLLYSARGQNSHMIADDAEHHVSCNSSEASSSQGGMSDHHYLSDSTSLSSHRRDSFRFSCPSLSLDCDRLKTPCPRSTSEQTKKTSPPPAILLGRALKSDDRDALRLSADAMARNLLLSFQKAVEWRIQSWIGALSASLVRKERWLMERKASEEEIRDLLKTNEAQLILCLRQAKINVQNAETCFRILPQRVERAAHCDVQSPLKKQRVESDADSLQYCETEAYQYTVCHALELEGAIGLTTPAGYSEIALEVPGLIEGTFLSPEQGVEELIAVDVEIDTNILASMVEKSCRVVVRTSVEKGFQETKAGKESEEDDDQTAEVHKTKTAPQEQPSSPGTTATERLDGSAPAPALVTPRVSGSSDCFADEHHKAANAEPILMPIPDDFERNPRRISAQTGFNSVPFIPRTPSTQGIKSQPSTMVTPSKRALDFGGNAPSGFHLAPKSSATSVVNEDGAVKSSMPVLLEVACAAMRAN